MWKIRIYVGKGFKNFLPIWIKAADQPTQASLPAAK
jgi:hypothetical protein